MASCGVLPASLDFLFSSYQTPYKSPMRWHRGRVGAQEAAVIPGVNCGVHAVPDSCPSLLCDHRCKETRYALAQVTSAGAEVLPFLASCGVLPASLAFFFFYGRLVERAAAGADLLRGDRAAGGLLRGIRGRAVPGRAGAAPHGARRRAGAAPAGRLCGAAEGVLFCGNESCSGAQPLEGRPCSCFCNSL